VDAIVMAAAAIRWRQSALPEDPAMPGAREYQRRSAEAAMNWARRRAKA
jgi:hypothetical protein